MNSQLLKGLTIDEKKELQNQIKHSLSVKKLLEYLEDKKKNLMSSERTQGQYDNPNWPYLQADKNGRLAIIEDLLKTLKGD